MLEKVSAREDSSGAAWPVAAGGGAALVIVECNLDPDAADEDGERDGWWFGR